MAPLYEHFVTEEWTPAGWVRDVHVYQILGWTIWTRFGGWKALYPF